MRLEPTTLTGRHVQLEPLDPSHTDELVAAANRDRATYTHTNVPHTHEAMAHYIDTLLAAAEAGTDLPFVQRRLADGALVGCTRYLNVLWWAGRPTPPEGEIGGTWLSADAQRTPINTEAKLLLLTYAFDTLHVFRVAICTDAANARSRAAIERIGGTLEGILRNHRPSMGSEGSIGRARDTAVYSITDEEWPSVGARLRERLGG